MLQISEPLDPRRRARHLYWMGWRVSSIARELDEKRTTIQSWKTRDKWDEATAAEKIESSLETRLATLIAKERKEGIDFKEIDLLGRQLERTTRVRRYESGGRESDLNPAIERRNAAPKKKPERNAITEEQAAALLLAFEREIFGYQKVWHRNSHQRTRMILKSRQIGATWYFAREALLDAIATGRNQIFLSASKAQAHVFKNYIIQFAREAADIDLKGDPIVLPNGAQLIFLGTNARTAQGHHGNFYFDEFFWVPRFTELDKVASGMALHKQFRKTYFSTPSSMSHEAFRHWNGDQFNKRRAKADRLSFDVSHAALKDGMLLADRRWRQIVTILDAEAGGCNLFDIDELRLEYSEEDFANLLMCEFIDDTASVFPLKVMQSCMVDGMVDWTDVAWFALRRYGHQPVSIGYDPSSTGDSAGLVVMALPTKPGAPFRVLERYQLRGADFEVQAEKIQTLMQQYNVVDIAVDATGMGLGVYQIVKKFFPRVRKYLYSPEVKTRMVLKAQELIRAGRFLFDASMNDIAAAFMAIRKTITASGNAITYTAGRAKETGHADLAWACMHSLDYESLAGERAGRGSMEIIS
ncbi:terminase large subunit domain-containing protein [Bordetella ansorpii]|nr:terminase family protein [Bordetella ansorpii]